MSDFQLITLVVKPTDRQAFHHIQTQCVPVVEPQFVVLKVRLPHSPLPVFTHSLLSSLNSLLESKKAKA